MPRARTISTLFADIDPTSQTRKSASFIAFEIPEANFNLLIAVERATVSPGVIVWDVVWTATAIILTGSGEILTGAQATAITETISLQNIEDAPGRLDRGVE